MTWQWRRHYARGVAELPIPAGTPVSQLLPSVGLPVSARLEGYVVAAAASQLHARVWPTVAFGGYEVMVRVTAAQGSLVHFQFRCGDGRVKTRQDLYIQVEDVAWLDKEMARLLEAVAAEARL